MSSTESETEPGEPIRTRKRQRHVDQWKSEVAKRARNRGEEYKPLRSDVVVPARTVGPLCNCGCMADIGNENINQIFNNFWQIIDVLKNKNCKKSQFAVAVYS